MSRTRMQGLLLGLGAALVIGGASLSSADAAIIYNNHTADPASTLGGVTIGDDDVDSGNVGLAITVPPVFPGAPTRYIGQEVFDLSTVPTGFAVDLGTEDNFVPDATGGTTDHLIDWYFIEFDDLGTTILDSGQMSAGGHSGGGVIESYTDTIDYTGTLDGTRRHAIILSDPTLAIEWIWQASKTDGDAEDLILGLSATVGDGQIIRGQGDSVDATIFKHDSQDRNDLALVLFGVDTPQPAPEPAAIFLAGLGAAALAARRRR